MNKSQFLAHLNDLIQVIPEKERNEIIEDYISHFEFGLQEGKTEEALARELGTPQEIAIEVIAEYERTHPQQSKEAEFTKNSQFTVNSSKTPRTIFSIIGLFLLNFVCAVAPLLLSVWAVWISLILATAIAILSPLVAIVDYVANSYFNISILFLSFVVCGASIFATIGLIYVGKLLQKITVSYTKWNMKIIKGAE